MICQSSLPSNSNDDEACEFLAGDIGDGFRCVAIFDVDISLAVLFDVGGKKLPQLLLDTLFDKLRFHAWRLRPFLDYMQ